MNSSSDLDPMAELNELDDLGNLFEFGDIDLNTFTDAGQYGPQLQQSTHTDTAFRNVTGTPPMSSAHSYGSHEQYGLMHQDDYARRQKNHAPTSNPYISDSVYQPSIQQTYNPYSQSFQFQGQPGFVPNHHVPPTPNS